MNTITEVRDELQNLGNIISLLVDVSASGLALGERSQAGLHEIGVRTLNRYDSTLAELTRYAEGSAASCSNRSRC